MDNCENEENRRKKVIITPAERSAIGIAMSHIPLHPFHYAKVLMQIGYEPLPPFKAASLFGLGAHKLYLPNVFVYVKYIKAVDGVSGLFRGLGCAMLDKAIYSYSSQMVEEVAKEKMKDNLQMKNAFSEFLSKTAVQVTSKSWAIVISHPIHVMAFRCMAQFIGGEMKYSSFNIFKNASVIYDDQGISGFFSGLFPRLILEASGVVISNFLVYFIKTYIYDDQDLEKVMSVLSTVIANSITYPLSVVSTMAIISNSALEAGSPPTMPLFVNWIEIFQYLYKTGQLKRGSSFFMRPYLPVMHTPVYSLDALD